MMMIFCTYVQLLWHIDVITLASKTVNDESPKRELAVNEDLAHDKQRSSVWGLGDEMRRVK